MTTMRLRSDIEKLLCCPKCYGPLSWKVEGYGCDSKTCPTGLRVSPEVLGKPVFIVEGETIFSLENIVRMSTTAKQRRAQLRRGYLYRIYRALHGSNPVAAKNAETFLSLLQRDNPRPRILVIGGGTRGIGSDALWDADDIDRISFDVYASENVDFIADAHAIPLLSGSIDGVWIQAVLEHVVDPQRVVAEILRILKHDGLVYADTPFMQQVHEAAFDFTRFSHSGHRWLFRDFVEISSGQVGGAGTVLIWAIRYLLRTVTGNSAVARLLALPFFWLRFLDHLGQERAKLDAASGLFFMGRKTNTPMSVQDIPAYYFSKSKVPST